MAQDAKSEFERIFGKTQKGNEAKPSEGNSTPGMTQKLPSDSDLLGIRTDSDRFVVKNLPESIPGEPVAPSSSNSQQKSSPEPHAQDAMTIALNVNVFANIADAKSQIDTGSSGREKDKQQVSGTLSEILSNKSGDIRGHADGPTFVIPLSKDSAKPADSSKQAAGASPRSSVADEFARIQKPKAAPSNPSPNTEFTRVLHIEDKVKVPKPNFPPSLDDSPPASTIAVTSDPKLPAESREPTVVTRPGPSDFTKVVKGSELRTLQEKLATAASHQNAPTPASWQPPAPYPMASGSNTQPWQSAPPAPVPQYIPASGTSWPGSGQSPAMPVPSGIPEPSKLSQYMPLIIALNLLVLIAILLIVFFAIKK